MVIGKYAPIHCHHLFEAGRYAVLNTSVSPPVDTCTAEERVASVNEPSLAGTDSDGAVAASVPVKG
jgi:hypothetical protein